MNERQKQLASTLTILVLTVMVSFYGEYKYLDILRNMINNEDKAMRVFRMSNMALASLFSIGACFFAVKECKDLAVKRIENSRDIEMQEIKPYPRKESA